MKIEKKYEQRNCAAHLKSQFKNKSTETSNLYQTQNWNIIFAIMIVLWHLYIRWWIYLNFTDIFNCSWTKFIAIIVNVFVFFYAKFLLDNLELSSDFYALDFLRFAWSKILSITISSSWIQLAALF